MEYTNRHTHTHSVLYIYIDVTVKYRVMNKKTIRVEVEVYQRVRVAQHLTKDCRDREDRILRVRG